jgi:hypothetical protein
MARRQWAGCAAILAMAVGLAGCSLPEGVDGDIADRWSMPPAAQQVTPKAGECHVSTGDQIALATEKTVDCSASHTRETTYIGEFTGAAAAERKPPRLDRYATPEAKAAQVAAYAECDRQTSAYVGHSWYHIRLRLEVTVPTDDAWRAGRRWYRCDVVEVDLGMEALRPREGSIKGVTLPATCVTVPQEGTPKAISCTDPHNSEYAGTFLVPMPAKEVTEPDYPSLHTRCRSVAATFLGVPVSQVETLTGTYVWFDYRSEYWILGRRLIHCLLWFGDSVMTGSAKGHKGRDLP